MHYFNDDPSLERDNTAFRLGLGRITKPVLASAYIRA